MLVADLAVVVLDAVVAGDVRADHLVQLGALVGAMQTGGDEDRDVLAGNALLLEDAQHGRQDQPIGHGPGDVADEDAGVAPAAGQLGQGGGADRVGEDVGDRGLGIGERRRRADRQRADDAVVGQVHVESGPAVVQVDAHNYSQLGLSGIRGVLSLFSREDGGFSTWAGIFLVPGRLVRRGEGLYHGRNEWAMGE